MVGDTEIRKGDGMQLDQLLQNTSSARDSSSRIQPFDLDTLRDAFQFRETAPVDLSPVRYFQFTCVLVCSIFIVNSWPTAHSGIQHT